MGGMTQPQMGQVVSFSDVLTQYRYDFAFGREPELLSQFDAANGNEALQLEILDKLRKPKPASGLAWRYEPLTKAIVSVACLPWKGKPPLTVPQMVARMNNESAEELADALGISAGSIAKIRQLAAADDCGLSNGYRHTIIVKDKPTQGQFRIYEGSHRLCALWFRFADDWPEGLGVYVGSAK